MAPALDSTVDFDKVLFYVLGAIEKDQVKLKELTIRYMRAYIYCGCFGNSLLHFKLGDPYRRSVVLPLLSLMTDQVASLRGVYIVRVYEKRAVE